MPQLRSGWTPCHNAASCRGRLLHSCPWWPAELSPGARMACCCSTAPVRQGRALHMFINLPPPCWGAGCAQLSQAARLKFQTRFFLSMKAPLTSFSLQIFTSIYLHQVPTLAFSKLTLSARSKAWSPHCCGVWSPRQLLLSTTASCSQTVSGSEI